MPIPLSKRCVAELFGTFSLVFVGCGSVVIDTVTGGAVGLVGIALAFGLVVMTMVYSLGHISGAHINPAVTVALLLKKLIVPAEAAAYILAQVAGAIAAAALLRALYPSVVDLGATNPGGPIWQSFVFEIIATLLLVFVILQVISGSEAAGTFAGAAIGAVVTMDIIICGPICGASMNPARSIGPALFSGNMEHLWLYLVAPIAGAVLAVAIHQAMRPEDKPAGSES